MKIKCEYCESFINDTETTCPNCGAVNENMKRVANGVPTTIEELKDYCVEQNLPISMMRFFIGENYRLPKAYGIYKDENTGECIVYKNKSNGERAIRYQGLDEAYAVNEIYLKLQAEVQKHEAHKIAVEAARQSQSNYTETRTTGDRYSGGARSYSSVNYSDSSSSSNNGGKKPKLNVGAKIIIIIVIIMFGSSILEAVVMGIFGVASIFTSNSDNYDTSYSYDYSYDDYDYDYDDYDYSYDDYDYSYDSDWDSDWDSGWDSGSDWDSSYSDWDSDW